MMSKIEKNKSLSKITKPINKVCLLSLCYYCNIADVNVVVF